MTIYIYNEKTDFYGPVVFWFVNSKEESCDNFIFEISNLLDELSKEFQTQLRFDVRYVITDFEKALTNTSMEGMKSKKSKGCPLFFQALMRRVGEEGLRSQKRIQLTHTLINEFTSLAFNDPA